MTDPVEPPAATERRWTLRRTAADPRLRRAVPFIGGVTVALIALSLYGALFPPPPPLSTRDVEGAIEIPALASQTPGPALSRAAYARILPSFVVIQAKGDPAVADDDELGSGVIIDDRGDILTALHVVAKASEITRLVHRWHRRRRADRGAGAGEGHRGPAGGRRGHDVHAGGPRQSGRVAHRRRGVRRGQPVRPCRVDEQRGHLRPGAHVHRPETNQTIEGLIQIDAAVNPGNSGGPLLDRNGRVVGIVTALLNPTDQHVFVGVGLAVPIDVAGGAADLPPY